MLDDLFADDFAQRHLCPDATLLLHGEPADAVFQVIAGIVRCCTYTSDGLRQIFGFRMAGDVIGLSDVETWHYTAEAVDHVILRTVSRPSIEAAFRLHEPFRRDMRRRLAEELADRERLLVDLAHETLEKRLLKFLIAFAARRNANGFLTLPIPRRDIGDHLGASIETVSRAFTALRRKGLIELRGANAFRLLPGACGEGAHRASGQTAPESASQSGARW